MDPKILSFFKVCAIAVGSGKFPGSKLSLLRFWFFGCGQKFYSGGENKFLI
jgi:hypothetical protein